MYQQNLLLLFSSVSIHRLIYLPHVSTYTPWSYLRTWLELLSFISVARLACNSSLCISLMAYLTGQSNWHLLTQHMLMLLTALLCSPNTPWMNCTITCFPHGSYPNLFSILINCLQFPELSKVPWTRGFCSLETDCNYILIWGSIRFLCLKIQLWLYPVKQLILPLNTGHFWTRFKCKAIATFIKRLQ